jgi:hypothetical protein
VHERDFPHANWTVQEASARPAEDPIPMPRTILHAEYSHAKWTEALGPVSDDCQTGSPVEPGHLMPGCDGA